MTSTGASSRRLAIVLSFAALLPCHAAAQTAGGYGDYLDWPGWARIAPGNQSGLASSWDRSAGTTTANHYEYRRAYSGQPGRHRGDPPGTGDHLSLLDAAPRLDGILAVRMYFDGESTPRPRHDFRPDSRRPPSATSRPLW